MTVLPINALRINALRINEAHDVRFGGAWTRGQTLKNDLLYALIRASLACTKPLSRSTLSRSTLRTIGQTLGSLAYVFGGKIARRNVRAALGDRTGVAHRSFRNLGEHVADLVAVLGGAPFEPLPIAKEALDQIDEARREGRGVIFASAHLGPWERVAATLIARGVPLVSMVRESYDPRLNRIYDTLRTRAGLRCIYRGDPRAPIRILRALREGAVLGMPMDLRTRAPSIDVPFFGRPASTVIGPARLALRTGAPLVVGTIEGSELGITAHRMGREDGVRDLTEKLNQEIERRIRTIPEQWLWMHPRW
jgi:KDO2-lipid IV(A) lauroyltransferase